MLNLFLFVSQRSSSKNTKPRKKQRALVALALGCAGVLFAPQCLPLRRPSSRLRMVRHPARRPRRRARRPRRRASSAYAPAQSSSSATTHPLPTAPSCRSLLHCEARQGGADCQQWPDGRPRRLRGRLCLLPDVDSRRSIEPRARNVPADRLLGPRLPVLCSDQRHAAPLLGQHGRRRGDQVRSRCMLVPAHDLTRAGGPSHSACCSCPLRRAGGPAASRSSCCSWPPRPSSSWAAPPSSSK